MNYPACMSAAWATAKFAVPRVSPRRSTLVTVEGSANTFGDAQLSVDVIADQIMWDAVKSSAVVAWGASEEEPEIKPCNPKGRFTVCWDPLDGSSIVDNNWAGGTMIGIW